MADEIIQIGAIIDLSQIIPGLQELVNATALATEEMKASMASLAELPPPEALATSPEALGLTAAEFTVGPSEAQITAQIANINALKEKVAELNAQFQEAAGAEALSAEVGPAIVALQRQLEITQALTTVTGTLTEATQTLAAMQDQLATSTGRVNEMATERLATAGEAVGAGAGEVAADTASAVTAEAVAEQQLATTTREANAAAVDQITTDAAVAAVANDVAAGNNAQAVSANTVASAQTTQAASAGQVISNAAAQVAANTNVASVNTQVAQTATTAAQGTAAQINAAANVVNAANAQRAAVQGAAQQNVTAAQAAVTAAGAMAAQGASATQTAQTLFAYGLSAQQVFQQLLQLGFSINDILNAFAAMGISMNKTANQTLQMAAAAGATTQQLLALQNQLNATGQAALSSAERIAIARTGMGALAGSAGMVESGLARMVSASKALAPVLEAAFPIILAISFIEIINQLATTWAKAADEIMGYTDAVKALAKENLKTSEEAQAHAGSIAEAQKKLADANQLSANIAKQSWLDTAKAGIDAADAQRTAWLDTIPILNNIRDIYFTITGAIKGVDDAATAAANAVKNQIAQQENLIRLHGEEEKQQLKLLDASQQLVNVGKTRVDQLNSEIASLAEKQRLEEDLAANKAALDAMKEHTDFAKAAAEARFKVDQDFTIQRADLEKKLGVAILETDIATNKAVADAERTVGLARVAQREALAREMYAAGKTTIDQEIADLRIAEDAKYEIQKTALDKRIAEAQREIGVGKDPTPELKKLYGDLEALDTTHQTTLMGIDARGEAERKTVRDEAARIAIDSEIRIGEQMAGDRAKIYKDLYDAAVVSETQYTNLLRDSEDERYANQIDALNKEKAAVATRFKPDEVAAQTAAVDAKLTEARIKHDANIESIDDASQRRQNEDEKRNLEEKESLEAKSAEKSISMIEAETSLQERTIANMASLNLISASQKLAMDEAEIDSEAKKTEAIIKSEIAQAEADKAAATSEIAQEAASKRIAELKEKEVELVQRTTLEKMKIESAYYNWEVDQAQKAFNIISSSFSSAFDKMLTEHVAFGTLAAKFWDDMVIGWGKMGLQIVSKFVENMGQMVVQWALAQLKITAINQQAMTARQALENFWDSFLTALGIKRTAQATAQSTLETGIKKTAATTDVAATTAAESEKTAVVITESAARVGAETAGFGEIAIASQAANLQEGLARATTDVGEVISLAAVGAADAAAANAAGGPAAMLAAAAAAEAVILSFLPEAATVAQKGGVLPHDMLVAAHAKEMILPPPISVGLQNIIAGGGLSSPAGIPPAMKVLTSDAGVPPAISTNYHTTHIRPNISINLNGQQHPRLTQADIEAAVMRGIRTGHLKAS